ncbi:MAG: preprotein translocase subunit YajC [Cytophagales bacterium]|nr:preprotein translocase subunit YajC [Bernardetiaceae bacterium]MDW8204518.1 preprotein translocase subunit YajC [Cytophagales bacterium]
MQQIQMILLQGSAGASSIANLIFIAGIILVFYFFMIRPQQKRQREQKKFIESLSIGDHVVTIGGLHGKIVGIEGNTVLLEADKGVTLKFEKNAISLEQTKGQGTPSVAAQ